MVYLLDLLRGKGIDKLTPIQRQKCNNWIKEAEEKSKSNPQHIKENLLKNILVHRNYRLLSFNFNRLKPIVSALIQPGVTYHQYKKQLRTIGDSKSKGGIYLALVLSLGGIDDGYLQEPLKRILTNVRKSDSLKDYYQRNLKNNQEVYSLIYFSLWTKAEVIMLDDDKCNVMKIQHHRINNRNKGSCVFVLKSGNCWQALLRPNMVNPEMHSKLRNILENSNKQSLDDRNILK